MDIVGIEAACHDERRARAGEILVECLPTTVTALVGRCDTADGVIAVIPERAEEPVTGLPAEIALGLQRLIDLVPGADFELRARRLESDIAARCLKLWAEGERRLLLGSVTERERTALVLAFARTSVDRCAVTLPIA
jgi:hypothetical protein